jgi:ribosome biogenesis GTPase
MSTVDLSTIGFAEREQALFAPLAEQGFVAGRVSRVDRGMPVVLTAEGPVRAEPAMHLVRTRGDAESRAVVGDWVALNTPPGHDVAIIEAILPRVSAFVRKDPGETTGEQVVAANVDTVFVVQSLTDRGVNLRRLERELVLAWESGATPVVLLTKADLSDDVAEQCIRATAVSAGVDVIATSTIAGTGLEELEPYLGTGKTVALLGGSGVGKSTLVNRLVGEDVQATGEVRESDGRGRHVTIAREMVQLPTGGVIIDTPGLRALALWDAEEGIEAAFPEIEKLAEACKFADCRHESEPGCAVLSAVETGELAGRRLDSYHDLKLEMEALAARTEARTRRERERQSRIISKAAKDFNKQSEKRRGRD